MSKVSPQDIEALRQVRPILDRIRNDVRYIEEVLEAIYQGRDIHLAIKDKYGRLDLTEGGSIRNLGQSIKDYLAETPGPKTSEEIAQALFRPSIGISYDLFKRRVIVTVSALFNKGGNMPEIVPAEAVGRGKEKRWVLNTTKQERPPKKAVVQNIHVAAEAGPISQKPERGLRA